MAQAQAGADSWKKKALTIWDDWSSYPSVCGRYSFVEIQRMVSRLIDEDGECFVLKTRVDGKPKIQVIESHRIGSWDTKTDGYIDGIKFDKWGRPTSYCYKDNNGKIAHLKADTVPTYLTRRGPQLPAQRPPVPLDESPSRRNGAPCNRKARR